MFDTFEPFYQLPHQPFEFFSSRFEIWKPGEMVKSERTDTAIICEVKSKVFLKKYTRVTINAHGLADEISDENDFDILVTGHDRLQFVTIPANGKILNAWDSQCSKISLGLLGPANTF